MNQEKAPALLTVKDLAERWHCSEDHVRRVVRNHKIPFVNLLKRAARPGEVPQLAQFRRETIERWEAGQEAPIREPEAGAEPRGPALTHMPGWDGKSRLRGGAKKKKP